MRPNHNNVVVAEVSKMRSAIILALIAMCLAPANALATPITPIDFSSDGQYNNSNPATGGLFRDVLNPTLSNRGLDEGGTGHTALNMNLVSAGAAGATVMSLYDVDPTNLTPTLFVGNISLVVDVLTHTFNNAKQPALVALFNEGVGQKGLALMISNAGNTDALRLQQVTQTGIQVGAANDLASVNLSGGINQDVWYRLFMDVQITGDNFTVTGRVFSHTTGSDPNSALGSQIASTLVYNGTLSGLGLLPTYEIGLAFRTVSTTSSSSFTNFGGEANPAVPEPGSVFLTSSALAGLAFVGWRKRRL